MSYSGLTKLLDAPIAFYKHYILNEREDRNDKYMIEGSLVHLLLLNPEDFDKEFVITPANVPSENPKKILHALFDYYKSLDHEEDLREGLAEFEAEIMSLLKEANLYQALKLDSARLEKICDEKGVHYWEYLIAAEGRTVIDDITYAIAKEYVNKITSNMQIMDLMGMIEDSFNPTEHFNETEIVTFPEDLPFGLRGFIDNMVIDSKNKIIRVNDLKKTSKDILAFKDSIEHWKYWIQGAMYYRMVRDNYLTKEEYKDFTIEFRFIVLDGSMQVGIYRISAPTMEKWLADTEIELQKAKYHFETRNFDLPHAFLIDGQVTL